jgi:hypothetical protein
MSDSLPHLEFPRESLLVIDHGGHVEFRTTTKLPISVSIDKLSLVEVGLWIGQPPEAEVSS